MVNCKNCGVENQEKNSFCSNCGDFLQKESENDIVYLLRNIGKGILNPAAYIRNTKSLDIRRSLILCGILTVVIFIQSFFLINAIKLYVPIKGVFNLWITSVIGMGLIIGIESGICYGTLKVLKEEKDFLSITNIFLKTSVITCILMFVPTISLFISIKIALLFFGIISVFNYVLMYVALKEYLAINIKLIFMIIMFCYIGSGIVNKIILSILV